ncbi:hypothetical protein GBAR_LOCUS15246 [Geodia barretti]|uniref:Uncharacterized protein n=1 Tax=Geodia barretti TaxID=519541 RepID=A0AA35WTV9_GEOBA|nr:hypothetical protein GBAR_LOCUS15246 [Geodia barretti]
MLMGGLDSSWWIRLPLLHSFNVLVISGVDTCSLVRDEIYTRSRS